VKDPVHEIECTYGDYSNGRGCPVRIECGEPFLLLNLETLYEVGRSRGVSGSHPDFVYIARDKSSGTFHVYLVELKDISDREQLEKIFEDIYQKFAQGIVPIKQHVIQHFNIPDHARYYAVIALPLHEGLVRRIFTLLKRFKKEFGSLRSRGFDECWIVPCCEEVHEKVFKLL